MKNLQVFIKTNCIIFGLFMTLTGCTQMSEYEIDSTLGLNGGFEVTRNGLPVNWLMYTPKTVPKADFKIFLDTNNFKEGNQSLRFDVIACQSTGGWMSPGFTNELFNEGSGKFKVSFWVRNDGTEFKMTLSGVKAKSGSDEVIIQSRAVFPEWTQYEEIVEVPEGNWLRINLNILRPGTFWIDDIKIERI